MIDSNIIVSAVTSGSGSMSVAATIIEPLVFGATSAEPQISISCSAGTPFNSGANVIIPIVATITAKYVNSNGVVYRTQELTEDLSVGYVNSSLPSSVVVTTNTFNQTLRKTRCCKSYELMMSGSIGVAVTTA